MKNTISAPDGTKTVVDAPANDFTSFGEATSASVRSTLIEIRATGEGVNPPAPSGDMSLAFTGKLTIGDSARSCTAALVDPYWVLTAKHCFADNPADTSTVTAGAPKDKTTVTVGRTDLATSGGHTTEITELVPHADRDLVMARLSKPATTVTPVALSATAPTAGETLTAVGFGRTKTEWVPSKLHSAGFTVGTLTPTDFPITAKTPTDATICQGDAGGPAVRTENGKPALVAITGRSTQKGCLDSASTTAGASDVRVDGAQNWVKQVRLTTASIKNGTSNRCLWVPWQTAGNDAVVKQYDCTPEYVDQLWKVEPVTGGNYQIRNVNSNRCLWVPWQTPDNGAVLKQIDCDSKFADQLWKL
ncbi:trypsin-like serine protease [Streptomyces roseus]|uniref:trypsin-like serine protease n=1 Tax=Streptomyces roseus TaxID=66430 RepID=UPI0007C6F4D5|nr:trypsin-like serine protease [Streptomyces roseus]